MCLYVANGMTSVTIGLRRGSVSRMLRATASAALMPSTADETIPPAYPAPSPAGEEPPGARALAVLVPVDPEGGRGAGLDPGQHGVVQGKPLEFFIEGRDGLAGGR